MTQEVIKKHKCKRCRTLGEYPNMSPNYSIGNKGGFVHVPSWLECVASREGATSQLSVRSDIHGEAKISQLPSMKLVQTPQRGRKFNPKSSQMQK